MTDIWSAATFIWSAATCRRFGFEWTNKYALHEQIMTNDKSRTIEIQSSEKSEHSRSHFLRSATGVFRLPWLESLCRADASVTAPPQRFAFIYTPNGYNQQTFLPETSALEPLANYLECGDLSPLWI